MTLTAIEAHQKTNNEINDQVENLFSRLDECINTAIINCKFEAFINLGKPISKIVYQPIISHYEKFGYNVLVKPKTGRIWLNWKTVTAL